MAAKENFSDIIAEADQRNRSWREKLEWVSSFLEKEKAGPDVEQLVYLSIYLRFISTGRITACEDGRHFRPSHHARTAQRIENSLADITGPANAFIIRKIYPYLPSYDSIFLRAEPLTRIRDIAHRNDIPQDLKNELKHTLQNKLHRCAGPEDLATSEAILRKITAPTAHYSSPFVEEFRVFHEELKEFFNALSLEERLETMVKKSETEDVNLIRKFLHAKNTRDSSIEYELAALEVLTRLRHRFLARALSEKGSLAQEFMLADIGLEDFAFMLLSSLINGVDRQELQWTHVLGALSLAVANLRLSSIGPEECSAIESGLEALRPIFDVSDREHLLLLKASLDRCLRLSHEYTDTVLALFPARVEALGRKLGVPGDAIRFFAEGDIRGNLVFQLSKLVAGLLKHIRSLAGLPPWDILVTGKVTARLICAYRMDDLRPQHNEQIIALLEHVEGDEEIPDFVPGIILAHELPHLSHLGVRARQGRVVFVACGDKEQFIELKKLAGERVCLEVTPEAVSLGISSDSSGLERPLTLKKTVRTPEVQLSFGLSLLELKNVTASNGGGKANAARLLEEISHDPGSGFLTPHGIVVPFGTMEGLMRSRQVDDTEYRDLRNKLDGLPAPAFEDTLKRLRGLILQLTVPKELVTNIRQRSGQDKKLMVRSSANCEDLRELAGAGLYDSVANVSSSDLADALLKVWASLWTKRAGLSRKQAGIPQDKACMALLIQQIIMPEYSFIMHTVNPLNQDPDEVYVELAVGLGETLASGSEKGTPYRMVCSKKTGETRMLSFANFSNAVWPDEAGGTFRKTVDYSKAALSVAPALRKTLGRRLSSIGRFVQDSLGLPQDIEGVITGDDIFLVQARPQQGL